VLAAFMVIYFIAKGNKKNLPQPEVMEE